MDLWMHKYYFDYRHYVAVVADTVADYGVIARNNFDFDFYRHQVARYRSMIDSIGWKFAADRSARCVPSHNQFAVVAVDSATIYLE